MLKETGNGVFESRPRKPSMKVNMSVQTKLKDEGTTNRKAECFFIFDVQDMALTKNW